MTTAKWRSLILGTLRRVAIGLSVFDPDHPLHDHMMSIELLGFELSAEGRLHLAEMEDLVRTSTASMEDLEFTTTAEIPDSCRQILSQAREGISELSWILWAVQIALEPTEVIGEPPGRPEEILMRSAITAAGLYSTSISRGGSGCLLAGKHTG